MALNNVPQPGQTLLQTRDLINANFVTYIGPQFAVDHQEFNSGANSGKHNKVTMPQQGAAPAAFAANEMGLFVINSVATGLSEMYMRRAPSTDIPITESNFAGSVPGTDGYAYLPSGILLKWGNRVENANGTRTITYSAGTPAYTTVHMVIISSRPEGGATEYATNVIPYVTSLVGPGSFDVFVPQTVAAGKTARIFFLAIGS